MHEHEATHARSLDSLEQAGDPLLFFQQQARRTRSPSVLLLVAILTDASACLAPGALVDARAREDAAAWVRGEIASAPLCSFEEVCAIFDLDEERLRFHLLGRRTAEVRLRLVA